MKTNRGVFGHTLVLGLAAVLCATFAFAQGSETKGKGPKSKEASSKVKEELVPLPLVLPKAMFTGTPKKLKSPNLERQTGKPRKPFPAPKGAVNLALGTKVTASDEWPVIGELELITDGEKDAGDGFYVELAPGLQHVTIDLGKKCEIYAVVYWHYHSQARVYRDVVIKVADDADFIAGVKVVSNNDHDNSAGLGVGKDKEYIETSDGRLTDAKRVQGRYVRMYSNGNTTDDQNHYIEVEVWGKPVE